MAGPADHWPPAVGAFWFHYWFEFWLQFWAASIAAQRAADLGAQLGAMAGRNAGRPHLHIVRDRRRSRRGGRPSDAVTCPGYMMAGASFVAADRRLPRALPEFRR